MESWKPCSYKNVSYEQNEKFKTLSLLFITNYTGKKKDKKKRIKKGLRRRQDGENVTIFSIFNLSFFFSFLL